MSGSALVAWVIFDVIGTAIGLVILAYREHERPPPDGDQGKAPATAGDGEPGPVVER
jgi:hypothetical protein